MYGRYPRVLVRRLVSETRLHLISPARKRTRSITSPLSLPRLRSTTAATTQELQVGGAVLQVMTCTFSHRANPLRQYMKPLTRLGLYCSWHRCSRDWRSPDHRNGRRERHRLRHRRHRHRLRHRRPRHRLRHRRPRNRFAAGLGLSYSSFVAS